MRKIAALIAAVTVAAVANSAVAQATIDAIYDPATGNLKVTNSLGVTVSNIFFISASGSSLSGTANQVPGTLLDNGDQPLALTYLNFPAGTYDIGNVVTPGTPMSDLTLSFFRVFGTTPQEAGTISLAVPEPATAALAGLGLIGFAIRRRKSA